MTTTEKLAALTQQIQDLADTQEANGSGSMNEVEVKLKAILMKRVIWPVLVAIGVGGTYGGYKLVLEPPSNEVEPADVKKRVEVNEKKIKRLGDLHFKQRKLILDQGDEIRDKLNAISPEAAKIPKPEEVKEARAQVDAWEQRKKTEHIEEDLKKGDPFAGLEEDG